jgi:hypothetical protein
LSWSGPTSAQDERIRAQRYGFDGTKNGPEFRANTVPGLHRVPMVGLSANGNIVIAWRARLAGPLLVHLQMFDAGGPVGGEQTTTLDITEAAMCALDSGRFVIAHVRSALDGEAGFDTTVAQASVFEANGAFANLRFAATGSSRIQSSWPTLAPLPGGAFCWPGPSSMSTTPPPEPTSRQGFSRPAQARSVSRSRSTP